MSARKPSTQRTEAPRSDETGESSTTRDAVRQSQRIASQLHQLIAASITVTALRSEQDILKSLAGSTRSVFGADESIVSLETGSAAPLRGVARRGKKLICEVPIDDPSSEFPANWKFGSETRLENGWLTAPILERRDKARGIVAVRRSAPFEDEDREVLVLLAQMASSALGAVELGRTVQSSEARLRVLIETAPVGIVESDTDGHVRWWNRAASQVFAWPEFTDGTAGSSFPEATLPELRDLWSAVLRGGSAVSYTHLDVYKRQSEKCPRVMRGKKSVSSDFADSADLIGICAEFVVALRTDVSSSDFSRAINVVACIFLYVARTTSARARRETRLRSRTPSDLRLYECGEDDDVGEVVTGLRILSLIHI